MYSHLLRRHPVDVAVVVVVAAPPDWPVGDDVWHHGDLDGLGETGVAAAQPGQVVVRPEEKMRKSKALKMKLYF